MSVDWNGPEIEARLVSAVASGIATWIGAIDQRAVELIKGPPKTGRVYRRRGVSHRASAPGEAPATDLGTLVNSRKIEFFDQGLRARLTFMTDYSLKLEVGTFRMEPRPFARRALSETRRWGEAALAIEIREALK